MKKAVSLLTLLSLIGSALVLSSCALFGVRIDRYHFPSSSLMGSVRTFDKDNNDFLSKQELEEAKSLLVISECSDLSGIEYLTNLETLTLLDCSNSTDLSGIEKLTNLKSLVLCNCTDSINLADVEFPDSLEVIEIHGGTFNETFVFDNEVTINEFKFRDCVFENGVLFKNDSVGYVEFGYCNNGECEASGDLVFEDCDSLYWFRGEFESEQERSCNIDLSGCDALDWLLISNDHEQIITSVDLSNCSTLSSFEIYGFDSYSDSGVKPELTLNICGCPNIEAAYILTNRVQELDISDCPYLISASEQTPYEKQWVGLVYESEDGYIEAENEQLVLIK